jgi:Flavin containing amine oxidoreductase
MGALLASRGKSVTFLERNPFVGGRCASYRKEGFVVDVFVHMFGRCEKGPFGEILARAGRPDGIRWWHASPECRPVLIIDEEHFPHPDPSFSSREERAAIYRAYGLGDEDIQAAFRIYETIVNMAYEETFALDNTSYSVWLRSFTDNKTLLGIEHQQVLLYSVITSKEASAGEMIRMIANAYKDANIGYPFGGCAAVPEAFLSIVRQAGGTVRLNSAVSGILVEKGRALGVTLEDGEEIRSPLIISNAGIRETLLKFVGEERLPPDYTARVRSLTTGKLVEGTPMGMIYLKLALDEPVIDAPVVFRNVRESTFEGLASLMWGITWATSIPSTRKSRSTSSGTTSALSPASTSAQAAYTLTSSASRRAWARRAGIGPALSPRSRTSTWWGPTWGRTTSAPSWLLRARCGWRPSWRSEG